MRRIPAALGLMAAAVLGLSACGSKDNTTTASSPTAGSTGTAAGQPSQQPSGAALGSVAGPDGIGGLKLGMNKADAEATGLVTPFQNEHPGEACPATAVLNTPDPAAPVAVVWLSTKLGVAAMEVPAGIHTPEGIGLGSSLADATKAYPQLKTYTGAPASVGRNSTPVPGNAKASYRVVIDNGKVAQLTLQLIDQDCYE